MHVSHNHFRHRVQSCPRCWHFFIAFFHRLSEQLQMWLGWRRLLCQVEQWLSQHQVLQGEQNTCEAFRARAAFTSFRHFVANHYRLCLQACQCLDPDNKSDSNCKGVCQFPNYKGDGNCDDENKWGPAWYWILDWPTTSVTFLVIRSSTCASSSCSSNCGCKYDGGDCCKKTVKGGKVKTPYWLVFFSCHQCFVPSVHKVVSFVHTELSRPTVKNVSALIPPLEAEPVPEPADSRITRAMETVTMKISKDLTAWSACKVFFYDRTLIKCTVCAFQQLWLRVRWRRLLSRYRQGRKV